MPERYVYKALQAPDSEIRLLELLPGSAKEGLQCRLFTSPISDLPAYQPLSYVWGPQVHLHEILVDDRSLMVTRNLEAALRRLRRTKASRLIWVDYVCINQEDGLEKEKQILLMADIYRRGKQTIVWLGEHDNKTGRAFAMLETMAKYADATPAEKAVRLHPDKWWLLRRAMEEKAPSEIGAEDLRPRLSNPMYWMNRIRSGQARISIFERSWFKRVWVVQEIAVSRRAIVQCGQYSTSWDTLEKAFRMSENWDLWEDGQHLQTLMEMRARIQAGTTYELGHIMSRVFDRQATQPVDRIYSILGLTNKSTGDHEIKVEYSVDVNDKFVEATRSSLMMDGPTQLPLVGHRGSLAGSLHPSWAWALRADPEQPTFQYQISHSVAMKCHYQAAGTGSGIGSLHFSDDGRLLFLRGIVFDKVIDVGPVFGKMKVGYALGRHATHFRFSELQMPRRAQARLYESKRVADPLTPGTYPGKKETRRQAWIGFLTGIVLMSNELEDDQRVREKMRVEEAFFLRRYNIRGPGGSKQTSLRDPDISSYPTSPFVNYEATTSLMYFMGKRRVVRTSKGYMALCDRYIKAGDSLALIDGVSVPVVLRPVSGGRWRLIGESYVYGAMYGELWSDEMAHSLCIE